MSNEKGCGEEEIRDRENNLKRKSANSKAIRDVPSCYESDTLTFYVLVSYLPVAIAFRHTQLHNV